MSIIWEEISSGGNDQKCGHFDDAGDLMVRSRPMNRGYNPPCEWPSSSLFPACHSPLSLPDGLSTVNK